jgi:hypothetical protein
MVPFIYPAPREKNPVRGAAEFAQVNRVGKIWIRSDRESRLVAVLHKTDQQRRPTWGAERVRLARVPSPSFLDGFDPFPVACRVREGSHDAGESESDGGNRQGTR